MSNVTTLLATLALETNLPSETATYKRHLVAALRHLRHMRFYFSEASDSFLTVAGQSEYARGTDPDDYPADLLEIDSLRVESGSGEWPLDRITFDEMRRLQSGSLSSRNTPSVYTLYADEIILWPTPGSAWTVNVDYLKDATLDTATGDEIDGETGAHTNDYFTRGEELLRSRIMYSLALGRAEDQKMALSMKTLYNEALESLRYETAVRKGGSAVVLQGYF